MKKSDVMLQEGQEVKSINDEYVPLGTTGVVMMVDEDDSGYPYLVDFDMSGRYWVGKNDIKAI